MGKPEEQLCTIRIIFPVDNDEAGIAVKGSITKILAEMPEAQIQFGLTSMPVVDPKG